MITNLSIMEVFEALDVFNNVKFYPVPHKYFINGCEGVSVTKVVERVTPQFDEKEKAAEQAPALGVTPEQLILEWHKPNCVATAKGSAVHEYIENAIAGKHFDYPAAAVRKELARKLCPKEDPEGYQVIERFFGGHDPVYPRYLTCVQHASRFLSDLRGKLIPIKSEFVMGHPEFLVTGMCDQIFFNKKTCQVEIWDWKTNTKFSKESKFSLKPPCAHLTHCKLDEYSLQLSCYKEIFQDMTGISVGACRICWFSEAEPRYWPIDCLNLSREARIVMEAFGGCAEM